ncbi:MAG: hypothetical protein CMC82_01795 [Flavobacteriaceae bacterium]|nr:hypothetical protein [Flavobacteriaceae bacterium]|tara:strand:+ start:2262 stop:2450 length:189 start_codon:yes stop_codon:yes gene_type:complete
MSRTDTKYTNNDGEDPRMQMDWQDIFELREMRDVLKKQLRSLNKQIKNAEQRRWKTEDDGIE